MAGDEVVVQLSPEAARALRGRGLARSESEQILAAANRLGVRLDQMHPDVDDAGLMLFFRAEVPDRETGERVAQELLTCAGVVSAYWKPAAELP